MVDTQVQSELIKQLDQLSLAKQQEVLRYAQSLVEPRPIGVPGDRLLRLAGTMSHEEAQEFLKSIDEECERIDPSGW